MVCLSHRIRETWATTSGYGASGTILLASIIQRAEDNSHTLGHSAIVQSTLSVDDRKARSGLEAHVSNSSPMHHGESFTDREGCKIMGEFGRQA